MLMYIFWIIFNFKNETKKWEKFLNSVTVSRLLVSNPCGLIRVSKFIFKRYVVDKILKKSKIEYDSQNKTWQINIARVMV